MAAEPGTIIVLNGVAGAGKTSLARAIQDAAGEPCLDAGIDRFLRMLPARYLEPPLWPDVMGMHDRPGAVGRQLMTAMHQAIAAIARSGMAVVADHVMVERRWVSECAHLFAALPAYLVGVVAPLEVLEQRERDRPDRSATAGEVGRQFSVVHAHTAYDVEVDTSRLSPAEAAGAVRQHVDRNPPRAFRLLMLFEGAPSFVRRLLAQASAGSSDELFDLAERVALELPESQQIELLDAHPRIGATPATVSAVSFREQGYDRDAGTPELQARLDRLNEEYERRYGFRFVVFVAGRSRREIADVMESRLGAPREDEKLRALRDVVAIARDRARQLESAA
ncbi:MAG: AAA family ATPase [Chloroflexota bacterium]|nr:AAA family ATPase [Chloroflexota bacterium]